MHRRRGIIVPFFFVALYLTGCGGSDTQESTDGHAIVDQQRIESLVKEKAEADSGTIRTVTCPEGVEAVKGDTITCDFYFEGGIAGYADVRVTSAEGDLALDPKDLTFSITD